MSQKLHVFKKVFHRFQTKNFTFLFEKFFNRPKPPEKRSFSLEISPNLFNFPETSSKFTCLALFLRKSFMSQKLHVFENFNLKPPRVSLKLPGCCRNYMEFSKITLRHLLNLYIIGFFLSDRIHARMLTERVLSRKRQVNLCCMRW